jgi:hypothetical protein
VAELSTDGVVRQDTLEALSKDEYAIMAPNAATAMMEAMSDVFSRRILSCTVKKGMSVVEICVEQGIPQSTCYKRIGRLTDVGAMVIEKLVVPATGKKYAVYRSAFSRLDIVWEQGTLSAHVTVNPDAAEKLLNAWLVKLRKGDKPKASESLAPRRKETGLASR